MAIIPKYQQRRTLPGTTGQQMAPLSIVGKSPLQTIGEAGMAISGVLSEAAQRIESRESSIARRKDFRTFSQDAQTLFDKIEAEGVMQNGKSLGIDNKATVAEFQSKMQQLRANALAGHTGNAESRAKLTERIEEQITILEANFIAKHNSANRAIIDEEWQDEISRVSAKVALGEMTLAEGNAAVSALASEDGDFAKSYDTLDMITKVEAAQTSMIVGAINRDIKLGEFEDVEKMLRQDSVISALPKEEYNKLTTALAVHRKAQADIAAEKETQRMERMAELGLSSISQANAQQQRYITTGKWPAGAEPTEMQKNMAYLNSLDPNSQLYRDTRAAMKLPPVAGAGEDKAAANYDRELHERGVSPDSPERKDYVKAQLAKDRRYVDRLDQQKDYIPARKTLDDAEKTFHANYTSAAKALMVMTGVKPLTQTPQDIQIAIDTAIKKARNGDFVSMLGGASGAAAEFTSAESDAATLRGHLTRLKLDALVDTLTTLKEQTGAVGQTSDFESRMYISSKGPLDQDQVIPTADTLVNLLETMPEVLKENRGYFEQKFDLVHDKASTPPPPPINSYMFKRASANADGTVPLDQFSSKPGAAPASTAAPQAPAEPQASEPSAARPMPIDREDPMPELIQEAESYLENPADIVTDAEISTPIGTVTTADLRQVLVDQGAFSEDPELGMAYDMIMNTDGGIGHDATVELPSGRIVTTAELRQHFLTLKGM